MNKELYNKCIHNTEKYNKEEKSTLRVEAYTNALLCDESFNAHIDLLFYLSSLYGKDEILIQKKYFPYYMEDLFNDVPLLEKVLNSYCSYSGFFELKSIVCNVTYQAVRFCLNLQQIK